MNRGEIDLIVVGSGVAGLTAACTAAALGKRVLVLESSDRVGGTTAISGGMVWIPANAKAAAAGLTDSITTAMLYLKQKVVGAEEDARLQAFLERGNEAIAFLEAHTSLRLQPVNRYPDYYPDLGPGGERYNPDFAAWARAAGADGMTVTRSEDLRAAVALAVKNRRPCVIDVHVDSEVRPPSTGTWQLPPTPFKEPLFGKPFIA